MKNKLIVTFKENETPLSDLEKGLKILKDLPQYCRRVIKTYMAYHTGQLRSYQEMAESLNLTVSTVGVQIKRCKGMIMKDSRFAGLLE